MTKLAAIGVCLSVLAGAACGGSSTSPSGSGSNSGSGTGGTTSPPNGSFKATVQGSAFTANAITTTSNAVAGNTIFTVGAGSGSGNGYVSIAFAVTNPAVKTFNVSATDLNFTLIKGTTAQSWISSVTKAGSSGTLTFTTFTTNRAVGTFSFVAGASDNVSGNQTVTNGTFDITF